MFVNRDEELDALGKRWSSGAAELLVVYGRRRVGKTALIQEALRGRDHLYMLADVRNESGQIQELARRTYEATGEPLLRPDAVRSWDPLFEYFARLAERRRFGLVLDEYPNLTASRPGFSSLIQRAWDERWRHTKLFLVLCGSSISMMEREALQRRSPLYGRRTGQFLIEPLPFLATRGFFPELPVDAWIERYAVVGGVPAYLEQIGPGRNLQEVLCRDVTARDRYLYDEVRFMVSEELREPRNYFSILQAIALGNTRVNEIAQAAGMPREAVGRYLDVLRDLGLVDREVPVTEPKPHKSKKGLYRIRDHYFRFWFRFMFPNMSFLEEHGPKALVEQRIAPTVAEHVAGVFEEVVTAVLRAMNKAGRLPFQFERFGRWWSPEAEIDVLGLSPSESALLACECKWASRPVGTDALRSLAAKVEAL
ncbi:MAG: ATP-binding protein, partial [Planctomycetes bacterium]|nr:ATP-binding protein [Planctomycetota bacterium]